MEQLTAQAPDVRRTYSTAATNNLDACLQPPLCSLFKLRLTAHFIKLKMQIYKIA
jgi:hypothetical protein